MEPVLEHQRVGRVAVEGRREVKEREADIVAFPAVSLDGIGVGELVNTGDDAQDREELEDLEERLSKEMIQVHRLCPDLGPVPGENKKGPDRSEECGNRNRGSPDPPDVLNGLVQEPLRVEHMEHDEEDVEALGLLLRLLVAERAELVQHVQAALGRGLLDQVLAAEELLVLQDELK